MRSRLLVVAALVAGLAGPVSGADARPPSGAHYADAAARRLHEAAMSAQQRRDESVVLLRSFLGELYRVVVERSQQAVMRPESLAPSRCACE